MDPHALSQSSYNLDNLPDDAQLLVGGFHRGLVYTRTAPPAGQLPALASLLTTPSAIPTRIAPELNGHMLTVAVELDGKVYRGTADLSQIFDTARCYLEALHQEMHDRPELLVGATPLIAADTVQKATDLLVGALCEQHRAEHVARCAGWFSDITNAVKSAANGVEHVASSAAGDALGVAKQLKGPILAAVGPAAAGGAMLIPGVGPFVAPLAASLATNLASAALSSGSTKQAAQKVVQQAQQMAKSNPQIQQALNAAHQAVAQTTAGFHTAATFANAAAGDPNAQGQVQQLVQAAQAGDQDSANALSIAQQAASAVSSVNQSVDNALSQFTQGASDPAALSSADAFSESVNGMVGANAASPRERAADAARAFAGKRVVGVVQLADGTWQLQGFDNSDEADDWFGSWGNLPEAFAYAAYFDKADPTFPAPLNESFGHPTPGHAHVSGWLGVLGGALAGVTGTLYGPAAYHWARGKFGHPAP